MEIQELEKMIREKESTLSLAFPALMRKVYVWMTLALIITAVTAYGVAHSPALLNLIYYNKITFFGLIIAELALVFWVSARIEKLSLTSATLLFILYSAINGATLSAIFIMFSATAITKTFLITACTFAVMAVYGYFTKQDLSSMGKILLMADHHQQDDENHVQKSGQIDGGLQPAKEMTLIHGNSPCQLRRGSGGQNPQTALRSGK